jgi:hypothetical protein
MKNILLAIGMQAEVVSIAVTYILYVFPGAFLNSLAMQNVFYCMGLESTAISLF